MSMIDCEDIAVRVLDDHFGIEAPIAPPPCVVAAVKAGAVAMALTALSQNNPTEWLFGALEALRPTVEEDVR